MERLATDRAGGFEPFLRAYAGLVYTVAYRCSGSAADAEDLAQEAFVRAHKALAGYPPDRIRELSPKAWLAAIVTNLWRNELRRRSRRPRELPIYVSGAPPAAGPSVEDEVVGRHPSGLAAALLLVPAHERVPVVLRHVAGLTYAEIAAALGCPEGTAKARVHRGLASLRAVLSETGEVKPPGTGQARPARSRGPAAGNDRRVTQEVSR